MSEYNEEIGSDQGIGMDQILREAEHDTASWEKMICRELKRFGA